MLEGYLVESCQIIPRTINQYGDYVGGTPVTENCRFRYIDTVRREFHQEVNDSDAMIWLSPSTVAAKGSTILFNGMYYQIEKIWDAKRLGETTTQFFKANLKIIGIS